MLLVFCEKMIWVSGTVRNVELGVCEVMWCVKESCLLLLWFMHVTFPKMVCVGHACESYLSIVWRPPVVQHDIVIVGSKDTSCSLPAKAQAKEMSTQRSISAPRFVIAQRR